MVTVDMLRITFAREVPKRRGTVALHLDAARVRQGDEHVEDAHVQQVSLQLVTKSQHRNGCRHLRLHTQRNVQHKLLALLHRARLEHEALVPVGAGSEIPQRRYRVALNLFVVGGPEEVNEGSEEEGIDDGGLVEGVDGDVADTGDRGENQG